jgi:predicted amidohydrolase YtcJ
VDALIDAEDETIAALHKVIPHSGQEPRSEALEHLIMRKQNQVDRLRRARRGP